MRIEYDVSIDEPGEGGTIHDNEASDVVKIEHTVEITDNQYL